MTDDVKTKEYVVAESQIVFGINGKKFAGDTVLLPVAMGEQLKKAGLVK